MPKVELRVEFLFSAAHRLPFHKGVCFRMHGHNYKLLVTVEREVDPATGMVMDFEDLRLQVWEHALDRCDHHTLNDFLENPTAENIVVWMWGELAPKIPGLKEIVLFETPEYSVVYRGAGHGS
ncbi:6-carboxytetrahydropterin synthase QueD [Vulgatibacter incomptus]|uniref:6-carboxy-5,6,7,8-tetrahydropterin synthase n=1 Tax=Vulgatibacter incomptus TaxID=1391653 RepID=A0A0K1PBT3_9BACT|nr:6-carboxytetrahydropterin synthase QueD [Vulgatibacter incomptus]AKU90985.1 Queuosine biosynthesis QueD, PTPS-I [Vulgatibacter incomptus]